MQAQKSEASRLPFQPETMQRSKPTATRKKPSLWKEGPGGWWRRLAGGVVALGLAVAVYVLYNKNNQPQSNAGISLFTMCDHAHFVCIQHYMEDTVP